MRKLGVPEELSGPSAPSAAADLGDKVDLAFGVERGEIGVLEDFAVDRHRHALLDLAAEAGKAALKLQNHPAEIVCLHFECGEPAGEPAGSQARDDDARHVQRSRTITLSLRAKRCNLDRQSELGSRLLRRFAPRDDMGRPYSAARGSSFASIAARSRGGDIGRARMPTPIAAAEAVANAGI